MELLKQGQYSPFPVADQVISIWAGTNGYLDDVPVEDIRRFESELLEHLRASTGILTTIEQTGKLEDSTLEAMKSEVADFKAGFFGRGGDRLVAAGHEEHSPLDGESVDQEKIVRQKR
jgi:F-type H+-transporting ATPase subunit alpha